MGGCGVGAGCGVDCTGGLKPASSCAIFDGALAGGAATGGKPNGMPCEGNPGTGVGGANVGMGAGVGARERTCLRTASSCCGGSVWVSRICLSERRACSFVWMSLSAGL